MPWVRWAERLDDFAPVVGLHRHEPFYPISVRSFVSKSCRLQMLVETGERGPVFASDGRFSAAAVDGRLARLADPEVNRRGSLAFLDRHGGRVDMRASRRFQRGYRRQVYAAGFRHTETAAAAIQYWFFFVENFVPRSLDDDVIGEALRERPSVWWTHEGDWETVSLRFANVADAHPRDAFFSQHGQAVPVSWERLEREGLSPRVLVGLGSHALFNRPVSERRLAILAEVARGDRMFFPRSSVPPGESPYALVELSGARHPWLRFRGRWGKGSGLFSPAPTGPRMKQMPEFRLLV